MTKVPNVFISYSWTTEEHKAWVLKLAKELVKKYGIDVTLDIWDLKLGEDKNYFMEKMLNADKVLIICEHGYKEKADKRLGGVGIETQIVSSEVYNKIDSTKVIPIIREKNAKNEFNSFVPIYLRNKTGVDMSDDDKYEEGIEQIVRDVTNQPKYSKPNLGKIPNYSENSSTDFVIPISARNENSLSNPFSLELDDKELDILYDEIRYKYKDKGRVSIKIDLKEEEITKNTLNELKKKTSPCLDDRRRILDLSGYLDKLTKHKQQLLDMIYIMIKDERINNYINFFNDNSKSKMLKGLTYVSLSSYYSLENCVTKLDIYQKDGYSFGVNIPDDEYDKLSEKTKTYIMCPCYYYASDLPKKIIFENVIPTYVLYQYRDLKNKRIKDYTDFDIHSFFCGLG